MCGSHGPASGAILKQVMTRLPLTLMALAALAAAQPPAPRTMRLDYVHSGTASEETLALQSIALEGA